MAKQTIYNAGIYVRLSQEDMRAGESLSIEHQKLILTKYVREQGWNLVDTYVDDGFSGTDFNRPSVQRLLSDAQTGRINLIICKDLSRFGRNYIEVGQYIDYIFPLHNIRFIALNDNVDTANRDSNAMEMMPVINLFNEWHASSTSKKIKAVNLANAKAGKYTCANAAYGYTKADDEKHTPIIDPEAAEVVRRIFKLRSQGMSPRAIGDQLNAENIPIPSDYRCQKKGIVNTKYTRHLWTQVQIRQILDNPIYLGKLAMMRVTSVSYKNHKKVRKDPSEWVVTEDTHEAIISQELWDKVREAEKAVSHGKRDGKGVTQPLSGMLFCPDCGYKMKAAGRKRTLKSGELISECYYNCSSYVLHGKELCSTHYISQKQIEAVIIADIRSMAELVVKDEQTARAAFLSKKEQQTSRQSKADIKKLNDSKHRLAELENLMQSVYEDKVMGKIPEHICVSFLEKYEAEQQELRAVIADLEERLSAEKQDREDVEEFIRRLKKYVDVQTLTRELGLELIEYVTVGAYTPNEPREINIYYKFLDKPLNDKKTLYSDENA
ncbi:recombinase family protein [Ruminococcus bicirculans (ex Wegman et al. 2014)]|uniref:recombinase family protein n=1 Tax=Ruminococcus bicirculans (ex Wegman et al. 2014) TaxID=1160721 RepID=UPI003A8CD3D0